MQVNHLKNECDSPEIIVTLLSYSITLFIFFVNVCVLRSQFLL